jgi:hypothetical protein
MQTRTYGDLFKLIQSLAGVGTFATSEQDDIANFINRRFSQAFNTSPVWERYITSSEEREMISLTLSGATASTSTSVNQNYKFLGANTTGGTNVYQGVTTNTVIIYNTGTAWRVDTAASAAVQASGTYTVTAGTQQFIEADTNKKSSVTEVEVWTPRAGSDILQVQGKNLIPYAQTGKTTIGEFNRIHRKRAFLNNSALEYEFFVDINGANLLNLVNSTDNVAFVTYKSEFTTFTTSSDYSNSIEEVPAEFFDYLAHSVYADFLRMDGQTDKSLVEEQNAASYLASELEKIDLRSNNNTLNKRFSTYVNRQSR